MKYETYFEAMEALEFRKAELRYRAILLPGNRKQSDSERHVKNLEGKCKLIERAERDLQRDEHWTRYAMATGKRR